MSVMSYLGNTVGQFTVTLTHPSHIRPPHLSVSEEGLMSSPCDLVAVIELWCHSLVFALICTREM